MISCPACGASNADGAAWCSQCFATLAVEPEPRQATTAPQERDPDGPPPADRAGPGPGTDAGAGADRAGLRRGAGGLEWSCVACETYNPMDVSACLVCGSPFTARFAEASDAQPVDWDAARRRSLVLPGLGHLRAGRPGSGVARALLFVVWLLGGLLIAVGGGARGLTASAPLLAGALIVYVASVVDIGRLEAGRDELLVGRTLLWLVVGVTALLVVSTVVGAGIGASTAAAPLLR